MIWLTRPLVAIVLPMVVVTVTLLGYWLAVVSPGIESARGQIRLLDRDLAALSPESHRLAAARKELASLEGRNALHRVAQAGNGRARRLLQEVYATLADSAALTPRLNWMVKDAWIELVLPSEIDDKSLRRALVQALDRSASVLNLRFPRGATGPIRVTLDTENETTEDGMP